ncbi:hypothetical protein SAMN04487944_11543 [Gracilibacillus ureilyticus]|uniref:Uncharacterized protein n=1 Tax=Gracilibacillus ureilyticus TaxID=531814 RepID=A0A1H9TXP4_9BACI|nr:hypothetical protein [Gracilibacillus ureilyticus]SES01802.1 hypothetical protein SAMN04487944_11543 [Gracilibacillus ureilyticus]
MLGKIFAWTGAAFFLIAIVSILLNWRIYGSELFVFYGLGFTGFILSVAGRFWKLGTDGHLSSLFKKVERLGFYGNMIITIVFFPPFYMIWGTFVKWLMFSAG